MQTFLPLNPIKTPWVLDRSRHNKQILECKQIVKTLHRGGGWANHPAVRMWAGYEWALFQYATYMHDSFGKPHKAYLSMCKEHGSWCVRQNTGLWPSWVCREDVKSSHRGRLLHKGMIDVVRKENKWLKDIFGAWNTMTVRDIHKAANILNMEYWEIFDRSHYAQFGWSENPSDDYVWP